MQTSDKNVIKSGNLYIENIENDDGNSIEFLGFTGFYVISITLKKKHTDNMGAYGQYFFTLTPERLSGVQGLGSESRRFEIPTNVLCTNFHLETSDPNGCSFELTRLDGEYIYENQKSLRLLCSKVEFTSWKASFTKACINQTVSFTRSF